MGDAYFIDANLHPKGKLPSLSKRNGICIFYGRDWGELDTDPIISETLHDFMEIREEYMYLFDNNRWMIDIFGHFERLEYYMTRDENGKII